MKVRVGVAVVLALVVVGCADRYGQETVRRDGITLWRQTQRGPAGGMMAIVGGPVSVNGAGCVMLGVHPVVWPTGTTIEATDPLVLHVPDGREVEQGVEVSGDGGFLKLQAVQVTIPPECRSSDGDVAVFNPHSELKFGPDQSS